jgi:hypothetical protein
MLAARDSIDAGARVANRFAKLRDLPEHPLYPQIHARLAMGENPFSVSKWVQAVVPPEDPYSPASMPLMTLNSRLRRYSALLPVTAKVPKSHLDELTKGLALEIDVVAELAGLIYYQKVRISQFAGNEKDFPLGITAEQQRREVLTLADLLMKMRDTQIALGLVPGNLGPQINVSSSTSIFGASVDDEVLGSDPFTRLLLDNPQAISIVMSGIDRAVAEAGAIEGQSTAVRGKDRQDD